MRGEYSYLPGAGIVGSTTYGLPDAVGILVGNGQSALDGTYDIRIAVVETYLHRQIEIQVMGCDAVCKSGCAAYMIADGFDADGLIIQHSESVMRYGMAMLAADRSPLAATASAARPPACGTRL